MRMKGLPVVTVTPAPQKTSKDVENACSTSTPLEVKRVGMKPRKGGRRTKSPVELAVTKSLTAPSAAESRYWNAFSDACARLADEAASLRSQLRAEDARLRVECALLLDEHARLHDVCAQLRERLRVARELHATSA